KALHFHPPLLSLLAPRPRCALPVKEVHAEGFGNAGRLALALDFDAYLRQEVQCAGPLPRLLHERPGTHTTPHRNHGVETHLVAAEVQRACEILDPDEITGQRGNERKRQVPVSNSLSARQFAARPLRVDVNPLEVARRRGELVDLSLVDHYAAGATHLLPFEGLRVSNRFYSVQALLPC